MHSMARKTVRNAVKPATKPRGVNELPKSKSPDAPFPIVGVGASAGGLEPFLELLRVLPDTPGMAFVFILHQGRHESRLVEVIERATVMPVVTITDGVVVDCNHVYLAPPSVEVMIARGALRFTHDRGSTLPIDAFLRSLAEDQGGRAIGVILSGSASDGALGMKAIKGESGITLVQDDSATFPQMPHASIAAGAADFVLTPQGIGQELIRIAGQVVAASSERLPEGDLMQIFRLLQVGHDVDFTHYKPSTVERRIRRRMMVHKVTGTAEYVTLLREDPAEVEHLYSEILIRVTGFFRDPDVFEVLQREIAPRLLAQHDAGNPVRVWVPGCATGEEAYSLAIVLLESAGDVLTCPVQIFGTDISEAALDRSRYAVYPENIAGEVSPERLRRFFTKVDGGYRVAKAVRDCCIFARQNLVKDPPFSRVDLVSCRNVMIYFGAVLQRRVMSILHYALRTDGYLLLGSSETVGSHGNLFAVVDRKQRIYQKAASAHRPTIDFEPVTPREPVQRLRMDEEVLHPANVFREADRVMLSRFSPAGVLINENMEVLQFRGRTAMFLEPPSGAASFNVLKMAREGLLPELRAAIYTARKTGAPFRREHVRIKGDGGSTLIHLEVIPFTTPSKEHYQLVLFETAAIESITAKQATRPVTAKEENVVAHLKRELEATRESLQSIIEEQEAMNEELRSANEEIQSSNEELQSMNEELETAKEELQSSNEELTTLNEELESRNEELAEAHGDLVNLLASIDIPIVMLDRELRIRRFNPGAQRVLNLIPADQGRSLHDLKLTLVVDDLEQMITSVIEQLEVRELEVRSRAGRTFLMRIRPYKTTENRIEGAVLVLIDIEHLKIAK